MIVDTHDLALARNNKDGRPLSSLEPLELPKNRDHVVKNAIGKPDRVPVPSLPYTYATLPRPTVSVDVEGDTHHSSYLDYLTICYGKHYGVTVSPTLLWFLLLTEFTTNIRENSEDYRSIFTTKAEGKTDIVVYGDRHVFNALEFVQKLRELVPTDCVDDFLPEFSTTDERGRVALAASFCDAVSPYYNYMMLACGIPKFRIEGTEADWVKMFDSFTNVAHLLKKVDDGYVLEVQDILAKIIRSVSGKMTEAESKEFWNDMFWTERCGSGSQTTLHGWVTKLFMKKPDLATLENWPSQKAIVEYTCLEQDGSHSKYAACFGLFSSDLVDGVLVPKFGNVVEARDEASNARSRKDFEESLKTWGSFTVDSEDAKILLENGFQRGGMYMSSGEGKTMMSVVGPKPVIEKLAAEKSFP